MTKTLRVRNPPAHYRRALVDDSLAMKTQKQGRTQSPSKSREIEAKPAAPDVSNVPLSDLPSGESSTRVSIGWSLDEKGKIDFSRMRIKTGN